jgi:hypothetical protein
VFQFKVLGWVMYYERENRKTLLSYLLFLYFTIYYYSLIIKNVPKKVEISLFIIEIKDTVDSSPY